MDKAPDSPPGGPKFRRRALTAGAAWAVPTVVLSSAAPALAASSVACPVMPTDATAWRRGVSGTVNGGAAGWSGGRLEFKTDANQSSGTATVTYAATVAVVAGTSYEMTFILQVAPGYATVAPSSCIAVTSNLDITASVGSQTQTLVTATSNATNAGSRTVVAPNVRCTSGGTGYSNFGAYTVDNASITQHKVFTPTTSGTMTLRIIFSLPATTAGNNDDWRVTPSFRSCTR